MALPENRLTRLRNAQGLTTTQVAAHCGVHTHTATRWEKGESGIPDKQKYVLAELYGVSIAYLMNWDEVPNGNGEKAVA